MVITVADFSRMTTKELVFIKESLELRSDEFENELEDISQELTIRQLDFCRPICDILELGE